MKHLFLPYELSLLAQQKGFNETCIGHYTKNNKELWIYGSEKPGMGYVERPDKFNNFPYYIPTPLYQQLLDWLREEKEIEISIFSILPKVYGYSIEFMQAWQNRKRDNGSNSYALNSVDQVLHMEKIKYTPVSNSDFENKKYNYYAAYNAAITEAFKLI